MALFTNPYATNLVTLGISNPDTIHVYVVRHAMHASCRLRTDHRRWCGEENLCQVRPFAASDQDFPKCFDLASPGRIPCPTWACAPAADLAFGPSKHGAVEHRGNRLVWISRDEDHLHNYCEVVKRLKKMTTSIQTV